MADLEQAKPSSADPNTSTFPLGVQMAAERLATLIVEIPVVKKALATWSTNLDSTIKSLSETAESFGVDSESKTKVIEALKNAEKGSDPKEVLSGFLAKNYSQQQLEYATYLVSDPRLGDLAKQTGKAFEAVMRGVEVFLSGDRR
jgi:hypothetical protein